MKAPINLSFVAQCVVILMAGCRLFCTSGLAVQPPLDLSNKTSSELVRLLESMNSEERECAAIYLGLRYKDPNKTTPNEPCTGAVQLASDWRLVGRAISNLTILARSDSDLGVRLCCVEALKELKYRTNTSPVLVTILSNDIPIVRIRAAHALVEISSYSGDSLPGEVLATLVKCLALQNPEDVWQAASVIGDIGPSAKSAIPALEVLKKHKSQKIREYATSALNKIAPSRRPEKGSNHSMDSGEK